jgi:hypothetical protein
MRMARLVRSARSSRRGWHCQYERAVRTLNMRWEMTGGRAGRQALRRRLEELTHEGEEDAGTLLKALITFLMKKSVV